MKNIDYIQLFNKFLQKQASADDIDVLIQWLKDKDSFQDWTNTEWDLAPSEMDDDLQQKLFNQIESKIETTSQLKPNNRRKLYSWTARIAAVTILLFLSSYLIYHYVTNLYTMSNTVVAVEKGQKANIMLPDGSEVWINSDSELSYGDRFNNRERTLLLKGEAYFKVKPNEKSKFVVETQEVQITALGTSFDVKSYENEKSVSVVLFTGKVEIKTETETIILHPNEKIMYDKKTGRMTKSSLESVDNYINWKDNVLSFNAETFENIAHTLERFYNTNIIFESEALKKYRFTGSPGNTSLESILHLLSLTSPLSYDVKDSTIVLRENLEDKIYYDKALK